MIGGAGTGGGGGTVDVPSAGMAAPVVQAVMAQPLRLPLWLQVPVSLPVLMTLPVARPAPAAAAARAVPLRAATAAPGDGTGGAGGDISIDNKTEHRHQRLDRSGRRAGSCASFLPS